MKSAAGFCVTDGKIAVPYTHIPHELPEALASGSSSFYKKVRSDKNFIVNGVGRPVRLNQITGGGLRIALTQQIQYVPVLIVELFEEFGLIVILIAVLEQLAFQLDDRIAQHGISTGHEIDLMKIILL